MEVTAICNNTWWSIFIFQINDNTKTDTFYINTYSENDSALVKAKRVDNFVCDIHADEQPLRLSPHHLTWLLCDLWRVAEVLKVDFLHWGLGVGYKRKNNKRLQQKERMISGVMGTLWLKKNTYSTFSSQIEKEKTPTTRLRSHQSVWQTWRWGCRSECRRETCKRASCRCWATPGRL